MPIVLTKGQEAAREAVKSGKSILITGPGGVGKSFLVRTIVEDLKAAGKNVLITASTGKAATLIGGVTCHRAFRIPISMTWEAEPSVSEESPVMSADAVLIDEVSMLRIDVFEYIIKTLEFVNKKRRLPQPIQLILVGDFSQLPPVLIRAKKGKPSEAALMSEHFGFDIGSGYAFNAPGWARYGITVINLTEVVRQTDEEMIAAANSLRMGNKDALSYFVTHARKRDFPKGTPVTYLCATNKEVDKRNIDALAKLKGKAKTYTAQIIGKVEDQDKPVPETITLKVGAHVLMAVNADGYHNGSSATVEELHEDSVLVKITSTGKEVSVSYNEWIVEDYVIEKDRKGKKVVSKEKVGTYRQLPLRLGYAMTIHRAQGQTLDKVVLEPGKIFCYGQLYVALSRVKSMDDLYIKGDLNNIEILASPEVIDFYTAHAPDPERPRKKEKTPEKPVRPTAPKPRIPIEKPKPTVPGKDTKTVACPKHIASRVWIFASTLDKRIKKGRGTSIIVPKELAGIVQNYIDKNS